MFSSAAESAGIDLRLIADTSLEDLKIDYLQLDSNRVDQVLINLLTNAIKYVVEILEMLTGVLTHGIDLHKRKTSARSLSQLELQVSGQTKLVMWNLPTRQYRTKQNCVMDRRSICGSQSRTRVRKLYRIYPTQDADVVKVLVYQDSSRAYFSTASRKHLHRVRTHSTVVQD